MLAEFLSGWRSGVRALTSFTVIVRKAVSECQSCSNFVSRRRAKLKPFITPVRVPDVGESVREQSVSVRVFPDESSVLRKLPGVRT